MRTFFARAGIFGLLILFLLPAGFAAARQHAPGQQSQAVPKGTILFVPQDNRPTSCEQTADTVRKLGYEVVMPEKELLGGLHKSGDTEKLWQWTKEQAKTADMAVISTDSLLYGGLVASRKHEIPSGKLQERAGRLSELHRENERLKIYAFASLMRTPRSGQASGGEEPDYYIAYGEKIFQYTALMDKAETSGLTDGELQSMSQLESEIPQDILRDWLARRQRNFAATETMADAAARGDVEYLLVGKDDNASLSQTHRESRWLQDYAGHIPETHFRMVAGIDEFAMLLMTRAVNQWERRTPTAAVFYNRGKGGDTIPTYSDERVSATLQTDIQVAGGALVENPALADFVLLVNTNPDGLTGEANHIRSWEQPPLNNGQDRFGTRAFVKQLKTLLEAGAPVGVADIAFTNGADNALMRHLEQEGLLFRLRAYAGWNTATNSLGFALGQGLLAARMPQEQIHELLMTRYLDDWGYQANVRTAMAMEIEQLPDPTVYLYLGAYEQAMEAEASELLRQFVREHLPRMAAPEKIRVSFPWHRMFIADIQSQ